LPEEGNPTSAQQRNEDPLSSPVAIKERRKTKFRKTADGQDSATMVFSKDNTMATLRRINALLESQGFERAIAEIQSLDDTVAAAVYSAYGNTAAVRMAALRCASKDEEALASIVLETPYCDTAKAAMDLLESVPETQRGQAAWTVIASRHQNSQKRKESMARIHDPELLLEVAFSSKYEDSRWEAISRLRALSKEPDPERLRKSISDHVTAERFMRSEWSQDELMDYIARINANIDMLRQSDGDTRSEEMQSVAMHLLSLYTGVLKKLVISSRLPPIRLAAVNGLAADGKALADVILASEHEDSVYAAMDELSALVEKLEDQKTLAVIAIFSRKAKQRNDAMEKVTDAAILQLIATHAKSEDTRKAAANRMAYRIEDFNDPQSLRLIIRYADDDGAKASAREKLRDMRRSTDKDREINPFAASESDESEWTEIKPRASKPKLREEKKPDKTDKAEEQESASGSDEESKPIWNNGGGRFFSLLRELIGI